MILALRREELSLLFPLTALTYIWVMILSHFYLKESISRNKIIGLILVVAGIILTLLP